MLGEKRCYPDGLIRVGPWEQVLDCLVEVKTGTNDLEAQQLENYLDIAREQGFDALLTITNEIPPMAGAAPHQAWTSASSARSHCTTVSWSQILAEAVMQKEHRGVADPDQAWILGELIRYLEHPRSGALEFEDMGPSWSVVRDAVAAGTLRPNDKVAPEVAAKFDALIRFVALRLGRQLGTEVTPVVARKDARTRCSGSGLVTSLATSGTMTGAVRIPNTVGNLNVTLDLRAGRMTCHVDLEGPKDGRAARGSTGSSDSSRTLQRRCGSRRSVPTPEDPAQQSFSDRCARTRCSWSQTPPRRSNRSGWPGLRSSARSADEAAAALSTPYWTRLTSSTLTSSVG